MPYSQDTRIGKLKVGGDIDLVLTRFAGSEAISEPFEFLVEALHETDPNVDFDKAIGKNATVTISTTGNQKRYFVGLLTEAKRTEDTEGGYRYSLVLRSWLYLLTKSVNSRIFHNQKVDQILDLVLAPYDMPKQYKGSRTYPKLEYVVQYRETDFSFISRLMESHGLSYHHAFSDGVQKVVITDLTREDMPGGAEREFMDGAEQLRDKEALFEWQKERVLATGKVVTKDYWFKNPGLQLQAEATASDPKYENKDKKHYEQIYSQHIGEEISQAFGKDYAQYRLDSYQSEDNHFYAAGDAPGLTPGYIMGLTQHPTDNDSYIVIRATHSLTVRGYRTGEATSSSYAGQYTLFPNKANKPYTPPMKTPKPIAGGVETGVVLKSEVPVDEWGRVTVRFHWNNNEAADESIKMRVAQLWAGAKWGAVYWPRAGMEAVVSFIDGDPDRPLIIGTVYNQDNMPPYTLTEKNQENISGIKSKTIGSSPTKYNEFIFDDTDGKELVRMHAQKDHSSKIEHDELREILNDRVTKIKNDETLTVDHDIMIEAKNQLTLKVGQSTIVMKSGTIEIKSGDITITATGSLKTTGSATADHDGGGMMKITAGMVKIN